MNILPSLVQPEGVSSAGICAYASLLPLMTQDGIERMEKVCKNIKSVFFMLFPYYAGERKGNLSKYARGMDYHRVLGDALKCKVLQFSALYPANSFAALVDDSPLPEAAGAALCGAGVLGDNGLVFDRVYGSYVFIGTIVTDLEVPPTTGGGECLHCGACRRACPGGALSEKGVDPATCLSGLTQKGGELTGEQAAQIAAAPYVWGCDVCSDVCPMNRDVPRSPSPAFTENLIYDLQPEDVEGRTRKQFAEAFPGRTFTWRGPAPLRRNLKLWRKKP